ncbi:MAG: UbiA-like polyprenyltransferase [Pirellula sp.]
MEMWERCRRFLELIRFSHTIFALPFAMLASIWAWIVPANASLGESPASFRWTDLAGILACMVTARSFAMAMNRLLDEKFDGENPRTAKRHLPAKLLARSEVIWFAIGCAALFIASTLLFLPNRIPIQWSVPVLVFLMGYSIGKRFTWLVHFWLGIALMLAPICAWVAIRGVYVQTDITDLYPAIALGLVVMFWVTGFDIIYACQDFEFDRQSGLHSIPAKFGLRGALNISKILHLAMWGIALGMTFWFPQLSLGWIFRACLVGIGGLLIYEHSAISEKSLDRMQLAFFQLNSIISVVFLVAGSVDAWLR